MLRITVGAIEKCRGTKNPPSPKIYGDIATNSGIKLVHAQSYQNVKLFRFQVLGGGRYRGVPKIFDPQNLENGTVDFSNVDGGFVPSLAPFNLENMVKIGFTVFAQNAVEDKLKSLLCPEKRQRSRLRWSLYSSYTLRIRSR